MTGWVVICVCIKHNQLSVDTINLLTLHSPDLSSKFRSLVRKGFQDHITWWAHRHRPTLKMQSNGLRQKHAPAPRAARGSKRIVLFVAIPSFTSGKVTIRTLGELRMREEGKQMPLIRPVTMPFSGKQACSVEENMLWLRQSTPLLYFIEGVE